MILLQHITKTINTKLLFKDISFKIREGQKVGLVGPNGAGKTTLLKIILQKIEPDEGKIIIQQEQIGYLPQKLQVKESQEVWSYLRHFLSEDWEEYKIDEVLARVGLKNIGHKTLVSKLSGGQKMKVGLARVLLTEPTTLLLDEPTNNLDVESMMWLESFVKNFPGKVLLISHDRFFLDACVNKIIELDASTQTITEYGGNYSAYVTQKAEHFEHAESAFELHQRKEKKMKEWIVQKQQQLLYHPSPKVARQLQAMKTRFSREIEDNRVEKPREYQAFSISNVGDALHHKKTVIKVHDFAIHQLVRIPELYLFGTDRVHLVGKNGAGKTTIMKSLLGHHSFYTGKVEIGPNVKFGYFSQEHDLLDHDKSVIQVFMTETKTSESTARKILGKYLFSQQSVFFNVKNLSEGEKARLHIALLLHTHHDFLFLDEPTNHLDLESREVLAEALREYEGGFLVVSHDRYFLQQIGITRKLKIENKLVS